MYTLDEIKEYISILENSSLATFELQKEDGSKIRLEKPQQSQQFVNLAPVSNSVEIPQTAPAQSAPVQAVPAPEEDDKANKITSPIVGVFYAAPSPNSKPYVKVGQKVKKGETVCIVEAMKCMNEIPAERDCEIVEILAKDGELVEYAQTLIVVK